VAEPRGFQPHQPLDTVRHHALAARQKPIPEDVPPFNKGDGTFENDSYSSGFALNDDGREIASMGIAAGDYENNGQVDFFVTDFGDDYKVLYHNDGNNSFSDVSYKAGVARTTIPFVGWGGRLSRL
jgi:hypothetical protein